MAAETPGVQYATALAAKDFGRLRGLFAADIDFRALTPRRDWQAATPDEVIDEILTRWFDPGDEIEALEQLESDAFADRERVGYRFRVSNADGEFLVEQQAYVAATDGRIDWMRVVCSGFRPV